MVKYSRPRAGMLHFLLEIFSIVGGLYMIFKVLDAYITACFYKTVIYNEVSTSPDVELPSITESQSNSMFA